MESTTGRGRAEIQRKSRRKRVRRLLAMATALAVLAAASPVAADEEYDDTYAGHPLRVVGYILHPIGVILNTLIFKPFYWIGSHEPIKTLVGQED